MKIIFCDELAPKEPIIEHMKKAGELLAVNEGLDPDRIEISLTFVGREEIQELNKIYRGIDKITDVLSFPQYNSLFEIPEEGTVALGDVVICLEQAFIQADEYGHSNERELVYLFVHSVCHLMGYDHMNSDEKLLMRETEELIMKKIGLGR